MATTTRGKRTSEGVLSRLTGRGEATMSRLIEELGANARVSEALERLIEARGRLDKVQHAVLQQLNLAAADEVAALRDEVGQLEKRLAKLEAGARKPARRRSPATKAVPAPKAQPEPGEAGGPAGLA